MTYPALRLATLDDLPAIVAIYNSTIAGRMVTADLEPVSVESRLPWFHAHQPARRPLWVAEQDGRIVAWISLSDFYGRPAYNGTAEVSIYLDESVRGQGMGSQLLQYVLETAPQFGVHTLLGFIFGHNVPSLKLFQRFGFASWAHLPEVAQLDGVARDLIILGRKL
ncbi:GNAT family N-acetyltransferase [Vogesella urethralis]|jgi:phosphinothricin acetyltransferase|uniref:GNAT family N-acetyltransferase n=1 Tax=Vogesella urethralis TaxID=2592656 RepID=UPI0011846CC1|nr:GNAT family N-acetyltransferase [Vogesella urethralis]MEC5205791.1 L-amino acid N-acyltransferase YncA [Vogesella perlucida]